MDTATHTPGPWKASQSHKGYWFIEYDQGGEAYTMTTLECHGTDARLIAAAPELLAALGDIVASSDANCGDSLANAIRTAKDAIAKAVTL